MKIDETAVTARSRRSSTKVVYYHIRYLLLKL